MSTEKPTDMLDRLKIRAYDVSRKLAQLQNEMQAKIVPLQQELNQINLAIKSEESKQGNQSDEEIIDDIDTATAPGDG